jgi:hypothetical protein
MLTHDCLLSIPKLIVDLVHAQTSDRVTLMALELAIVILGRVAPPTPVQQAFYEVLKTDDRKTSAFMGEWRPPRLYSRPFMKCSKRMTARRLPLWVSCACACSEARRRSWRPQPYADVC